jgi:tRNA G10  N-methylase Trm11
MSDARLFELPEVAERHPARFTPAVLAAIAELIARHGSVTGMLLDPFAGTGGIHDLSRWLPDLETVGVELEARWAAWHPRTIVADARALPFRAASLDVVATSPAYGNRMADSYDGRDGSDRRTYRIALGQALRAGNSGALRWGEEYRQLHRTAWAEAVRVLRPGGLFVLNVKDPPGPGGVLLPVTDWHLDALAALGLRLVERREVPVPGYRRGRGAERRARHEIVAALCRAHITEEP